MDVSRPRGAAGGSLDQRDTDRPTTSLLIIWTDGTGRRQKVFVRVRPIEEDKPPCVRTYSISEADEGEPLAGRS